eukprot:CAMPEP_0167740990 /NCGR_PEP_ID=MMETSP0110_2-20121227/604_1 /TAXON_ID=629695 /ORGANISM="Gymnochlora sp., Strain CCMP2014" /LENGTH=562 /DNA_ID=CAMNT_0007624985 /DNA_START=57 /DNA_END=1745 /DNA_ORIENTATION=-
MASSVIAMCIFSIFASFSSIRTPVRSFRAKGLGFRSFQQKARMCTAFAKEKNEVSPEEVNNYISRKMPKMVMDERGSVFIINDETNEVREIDKRGKTKVMTIEEFRTNYVEREERKKAQANKEKKVKTVIDPKENAILKSIDEAKGVKTVLRIADGALSSGLLTERVFARCIRRFVLSKQLEQALEVYQTLRPAMPQHSPTILSQEVFIALLAQEREDSKSKEIAEWLFAEISKNTTSFDKMRMGVKERCIYGLIRANKTMEAKQLIQAVTMWNGDTSPGNATLFQFNQMIRWFGKAKDLDGVFVTMDAIRRLKLDYNHETFEFLANGAVQGVKLIKKSNSMTNLPKATVPEIVFIGRSNVGKSSLVNMVVNRKSLAPMSIVPGRTKTFNYYIVNRDSKHLPKFYIVDVPGYGYAEATEAQILHWKNMLNSYIHKRDTLKVIFHLIDSSHGPVEEDERLMKTIAEAGRDVAYVVILTKADRSDARVKQGKAKASLRNRTLQALKKHGFKAGEVPVFLTSSRSKIGRDHIWRYIQRVMEIKDGNALSDADPEWFLEESESELE